jgi:vitellogenic carboxypeptidase-like protein
MCVQEAQQDSRVVLPEAPDVVSHAGFITVNKLFNSNLFFWYFPAAFKPEAAPLLIWLQAKAL